MESKEELMNQDLNDVTGGSNDLDDYLNKLAGKDKNEPLVDYGTGSQLDLDPSVQKDDDSKLIIINREKPFTD